VNLLPRLPRFRWAVGGLCIALCFFCGYLVLMIRQSADQEKTASLVDRVIVKALHERGSLGLSLPGEPRPSGSAYASVYSLRARTRQSPPLRRQAAIRACEAFTKRPGKAGSFVGGSTVVAHTPVAMLLLTSSRPFACLGSPLLILTPPARAAQASSLPFWQTWRLASAPARPARAIARCTR
jgi:hypothetical protein